MRAEVLEIDEAIGQRLRESREKRGISMEEMAAGLCGAWEIDFTSARSYLHDLECNTLSRLAKKNIFNRVKSRPKITALALHQQRIADYLAFLGYNRKEGRAILSGIEILRPEFKYVPSNIRPYNKS